MKIFGKTSKIKVEEMESLNDLLKNWSTDQGKKVLMTIFPHPDDETMATGGLLAVAHRLGWKTIAVVLTGGEAGRIHLRPNGRTLKHVRKEELKKAAKILGITKLITDDFGDGKLKGQEEGIGHWVEEILQQYKPAIIATYDHFGATGHPDHITTSIVVKKIIREAPKKNQPLLFWLSLEKSFRQRMSHPEILKYASNPDYVLNLGWFWFKKWQAARAHKSQGLGKKWPLPLGQTLFLNQQEWYYKVDLTKDYPYQFVDYQI